MESCGWGNKVVAWPDRGRAYCQLLPPRSASGRYPYADGSAGSGFSRGLRGFNPAQFPGTREPVGKKGGIINLYEAFGALCRDEEMFRAQLKRYASMDEPRILPIQVPPLVPSHMLAPTAKNKMFNASVVYQNRGKEWTERTLAPIKPTDIQHNFSELEKLLSGATLEKVSVAFRADDDDQKFDVLKTVLTKDRVLSLLKAYRWLGKESNGSTAVRNPLAKDIGFLEGSGTRIPGFQINGFFSRHKYSRRTIKKLTAIHFRFHSGPVTKMIAF